MRAQYELTQRFTAEFSVRAYLDRYPERTLRRLGEWAVDPNVHVRRLVSEGTRPRLPWAPRLRRFQEEPAPVLDLLERLKDDPEEYGAPLGGQQSQRHLQGPPCPRRGGGEALVEGRECRPEATRASRASNTREGRRRACADGARLRAGHGCLDSHGGVLAGDRRDRRQGADRGRGREPLRRGGPGADRSPRALREGRTDRRVPRCSRERC